MLAKKRQKLLKIDEEMTILRDKLSPFKINEHYNKRSEILKKHLEKEETDQRLKKKKHLIDLADYKNNKVFRWQNKEGSVGGNNPNGEVAAGMSLAPAQVHLPSTPKPSYPLGQQISQPPRSQTRGFSRGKGRGVRRGECPNLPNTYPTNTYNRFNPLKGDNGYFNEERYITEHPSNWEP